MTELPLDTPAEDVAEQRAEAYPDGRGPVVLGGTDTPLEADPADARDQADEVPLYDEEWQ